ncbi:MAG: ISAs1 family transposase [Saprospiraceae bacterium]|nr:ISAs1 family transposase [Saprospiraceae bacterium]
MLSISAVVSGCTEWGEIVDFGEDKLAWLRQYRPFDNGIPAHDTLNRVMSLISPSTFSDMFVLWANRNLKLDSGTLVSIDGKRLRGSATKEEQQLPRSSGGKSAAHLLEAWCNDLSVCMSVRQVESKTNEIKVVPSILDDLALEGCVISMDAMGCQKDIVKKICEGKADYLIGLKGNQSTLASAVQQAFTAFDAKKQPLTEQNTGHGRIEERTCRVIKAQDVLQEALTKEWTGLNAIIEIEYERAVVASARIEKEKRYYISSLQPDAQQLATYIRNHWGIENRLHYMLDVYWGEDESKKQVAYAATNFGILLRIAHNLVKLHPEKISVKRKLKRADRSDSYREQILRLQT